MRARVERWAPWVAGLVLLAGVASYTASRLRGGAPAATGSAAGASVPLDPRARAVAEEFVATAVARRHLDRAWQLAAPSLRGRLTRAQWRAGSIPVPPYPVSQARARYAVEASLPDRALLRVSFRPAPGSSARPGRFTIGLVRLGGRWRVASYASASTIAPSRTG